MREIQKFLKDLYVVCKKIICQERHIKYNREIVTLIGGIEIKKNKFSDIVFHKESCITCKKTISEIQRMKKDIEKRDFFKDPFSESELKKIIKMTGKRPKELLRKRDKNYKELGFETKRYSDEQIIKLMVRYPGLILRPIVIMDGNTFVGKSSV